MRKPLTNGFVAGFLGALILVIVMYIMDLAGMGEPGFVAMHRAAFGINPPMDHVVAAIIFVTSGGVWGSIFAWMVKQPTVFKGFLFGFLPTLWLWTVVNYTIGKPLFNGFEAKGLLLPIIFNMVIWGSFAGWYLSRKYASYTSGTKEPVTLT